MVRTWLALSVFLGLASSARGAEARDALAAIDHGLLRAETEARAAQPLTVVQADRFRIQRHLARVERSLRLKPVPHLTVAQRELRERSLDVLHDYWTAGVFPHNTEHPGELRPYFIDDDGRACAVAFLLQQAGEGQLAQAVDERYHNGYVQQMDEPRLASFAARAGLEVAELALIQPSYCECTGEYEPVCGTDGLTYWNECATTLCGRVEIAHRGACDYGPLCELCGAGNRLAVLSDCAYMYGACELDDVVDVVPVSRTVAHTWVDLQHAECPADANYYVGDGYGWRAVDEEWDCEQTPPSTGGGGQGGNGGGGQGGNGGGGQGGNGGGGQGGNGGGGGHNAGDGGSAAPVAGSASGMMAVGGEAVAGGGTAGSSSVPRVLPAQGDDAGCALTPPPDRSRVGWFALIACSWLVVARR
jgi:hypothetical protein